ncbi:MAG: histidine kinase, partial [Bacteroidetes bacterium]|nr:histidine kinase [Bacteroidota bacterium]
RHYAYIAVAGGRKMFLRVSWLLFLIDFFVTAQAQERLFIQLNARNGLPSNKVYSVNQDRKGYIWLATDRGAVRWNGHEFKRFSIENGLPDNEVLHVCDDEWNRNWVLCFSQKPACLAQGLSQSKSVDDLLGGFKPAGLLNYSYLNQKRQYWLSSRNDSGVFLIARIGAGERYRMRLSLDVEGLNIMDVVHAADGSTDCYIPGMVLHLKKGSQIPEQYSIAFPDIQGIPVFRKRPSFHFMGRYYAVSKEGNLLEFTVVNHRPILHRFEPLPLDARNYFFRNNKPYLYDDKGRVYDVLQGVFVGRYEFLANKQVNELYYDRQDNLWVSTLNSGVYLYPSRSLPISIPEGIKDGITHARFGKYHVIGTEYNGLYVLDAAYQVIRHLPELSRPVAIAVNSKYCVVASDKGLMYLDPSLKMRQCGTIRILKDIHHLHGDTFYAANFTGAYRITLTSGKPDTLYQGRTTAIWGDNSGVVWVGTMKGLIRLKYGITERVLLHPLLKESRITDIAGDTQGRIFVATQNNGLFVIHQQAVLHCGPDRREAHCQLPDRQLIRLLVDGNKLWVLGHSGLTMLRFHENAITPSDHQTFGSMSGLVAGIYYDINMSNEDGTPELLTDLGVVRINNTQRQPEPLLSAEIEGMSHHGIMLNNAHLQSLAHDENELTIHFNAIALLTGPDFTYEYRLVELDTVWMATNANQVHFSDLKPGTYTFQVRVRAGSACSKPAEIRFNIRQAWFQRSLLRWLLFVITALFLCFLLFAYTRRAARKMQVANQENQKLAELELKVLRSRMNPHFVFNVLTAIQNFITQGREQEANYYTSQFAQLIRQTFHGSASNFVSLAEELQLLNSYLDLERMRFDNRLEYSIEVDEQLNPEEFSVPSLLLQPFLENAINHGIRNLKNRKGMLFVRLKKQNNNRLIIEVEDNGVGINATQNKKKDSMKAAHHKSEGMKLAKDRIELMNRSYHMDMQLTVRDLSEQGGTGTLVMIYLPVQAMGELRGN